MTAVVIMFWLGVALAAIFPTVEERQKFRDARRNRRTD